MGKPHEHIGRIHALLGTIATGVSLYFCSVAFATTPQARVLLALCVVACFPGFIVFFDSLFDVTRGFKREGRVALRATLIGFSMFGMGILSMYGLTMKSDLLGRGILLLTAIGFFFYAVKNFTLVLRRPHSAK